jgi:ABC-type antimicrobial peptide transport system permease subunit
MPAMVASAATLARSIGYYLLAMSLLAVWLAAFCASAKALAEFHRRKREVGIRLALGSTKAKIVGLFVYSDLAGAIPAVGVGIVLAWWFARLVQQLLYDVDLLDPMSYLAGAAVLLGAIVSAQVLLLRNALRENPRDLIDAP